MKCAATTAFVCMLGAASLTSLPVYVQAQGGQGQGPRLTSYPSRPKAPQDVLDRGKALFGLNCAFCHGSDAGGGEVGPNLKRSGVVLEDQSGELITPIVHGSRVQNGMPRIDLPDAQVSDIAAWLHSLAVTSRTDPNAENIDIVVGDAKAGAAYFQKTCASCHSVTGDLQGIGSKVNNAKNLQQWWLVPGSGGRGSGASQAPAGLHAPKTTAIVTLASGEKVEGTVNKIDDFNIWLTLPDGSYRSFDRIGNVPRIDLHNPIQPHIDLLLKYTDKDIHDMTAYLVTLK